MYTFLTSVKVLVLAISAFQSIYMFGLWPDKVQITLQKCKFREPNNKPTQQAKNINVHNNIWFICLGRNCTQRNVIRHLTDISIRIYTYITLNVNVFVIQGEYAITRTTNFRSGPTAHKIELGSHKDFVLCVVFCRYFLPKSYKGRAHCMFGLY